MSFAEILTDQRPCVIDVRTEAEFQTGALQGAINLPLAQLEQRLDELPSDRQASLVIYCASGGRSAMACTLLRQHGYIRALNAGGLWAAAAALGRSLC